jgi:peptide/nickel transport system permease protein
MTLGLFLLKRLASAFAVMFAVSVIVFLIFMKLPNGDPALRLAGPRATPQQIILVRADYGLDKPLYVQYGRLMEQILTGNVQSYTQHVPVMGEIERGLPATVSVAVGGAVLWLVAGIALGLRAALREGKPVDLAINAFSVTMISLPQLGVGALLLLVVSVKLKLLPAEGYVGPTQDPIEWLTHMILPWITLAALYVGIYTQVFRSTVLNTLTTEAVRTARAKGLRRRTVLRKHVLRMSLVPVIALWGLDLGVVLGGTMVVETIFNLQGIGQYMTESLRALDIPPVMVVTLLGTFFVVAMNAVVDITYAVLDPRLR